MEEELFETNPTFSTPLEEPPLTSSTTTTTSNVECLDLVKPNMPSSRLSPLPDPDSEEEESGGEEDKALKRSKYDEDEDITPAWMDKEPAIHPSSSASFVKMDQAEQDLLHIGFFDSFPDLFKDDYPSSVVVTSSSSAMMLVEE